MSYFSVKPDKIDICTGNLSQISRSIGGICQEIMHIDVCTYLNSSSAGMVNDTLKKISGDIELQQNNMNYLAGTLRQISFIYKNTENKVAGESVFGVDLPGNAETGHTNGNSDSGTGGLSEVKADTANTNSVTWIGGSAAYSTTIMGINAGTEVSGEIGGASWDHKFTSGVKRKDGKLDSISIFDAKIAGEAHIAKGKVGGNFGVVSGSLEGTAGQVKAEGSVGATLYKNGKLAPQVGVNAEVSGAAVTGKAKVKAGSDNTDIHASAEGSLLSGKAKGNVGLGKVTYKDDDGTVKTGYGVSAEAKAEAYLAQGKVKGGFKIFGIEVNVGVSGKAGGAGASIGGHAVAGSVGGNIGIGLGIGAELEFNIDWTNFKWGW